jgi:anti-anti-sigma factor
MLAVRSERAGDVVLAKCEGRIVRGQEATLKNAVLAGKLPRMIVLDLTHVQTLDAAGLGLLVSLHQWAAANRVQLKLVNPRPFVHEVLTRTHLDRLFDISSFNDALVVFGECEHCNGHPESRSHAAAR